MKKFEDLVCLIIEDKPDHIESARNALKKLNFKRNNILPNAGEQVVFAEMLGGNREQAFENLLSMITTPIKNEGTIPGKNIDFILLDMAWEDDERPPNTSGEKFISFLEEKGLNKLPIIGYSKCERDELRKSISPLFYIQKLGTDVSIQRILDEFKTDIRIDALTRLCNNKVSNDKLKTTVQEQKVMMNIFIDYVHSSNMSTIKEELIKVNLYNNLSEEEIRLINKLIDNAENKELVLNMTNALLANPNSAKIIENLYNIAMRVLG